MSCEGINFNPQGEAADASRWDEAAFAGELARAKGNNRQDENPQIPAPSEGSQQPVVQDNTETTGQSGSISVLDGAVTVTGANAEMIAARIEELYNASPTFRDAIDQMVARGDSIQLTTTAEGTGMAANGWAYLGGGDALINLNSEATPEMLDGLIFHELGAHAALALNHGPELEAAEEQMMREVGNV